MLELDAIGHPIGQADGKAGKKKGRTGEFTTCRPQHLKGAFQMRRESTTESSTLERPEPAEVFRLLARAVEEHLHDQGVDEESIRAIVAAEISKATLPRRIDVQLPNGTVKAIRLDDAVPGDELERPGFTALIRDAIADPRISHVFAYARDRFGRPKSPLEMMRREMRLLEAGITIVLPDAELQLPVSGQLDIAQQIKMLVDYHMSGEQPRKLAEQMIRTQRVLAGKGFSIGGNAPYGFVRALVDERTLQILDYLPPGRRVRQSGCHIMWLPDPNGRSRLETWILMLELKERGWGYKRIACYLNAQGTPSPAAGTTRTDHGRPHVIEGKWNHSTVKDLLENSTILSS